ncbi:TPA: 30S ribosomal protein S17 [Vibrio cholerae]
MSSQDFDDLHDIINKWDSLYAYYNLDVGHVKISKDKSLDPEFLVKRNFNKYIKGTVVKAGMDKTVTVLVSRKVVHQPTGKRISRSTKYLIHDPFEMCCVGDEVLAVETRPISKRKRHKFYRKITP